MTTQTSTRRNAYKHREERTELEKLVLPLRCKIEKPLCCKIEKGCTRAQMPTHCRPEVLQGGSKLQDQVHNHKSRVLESRKGSSICLFKRKGTSKRVLTCSPSRRPDPLLELLNLRHSARPLVSPRTILGPRQFVHEAVLLVIVHSGRTPESRRRFSVVLRDRANSSYPLAEKKMLALLNLIQGYRVKH